jgi:hypothetical protein
VSIHVGKRATIDKGGAMFASKTRVLLILAQDVLDEARIFAGKATTALKMPVSLQIVLRALIEEGLKRGDDRGILANVERQAHTVRQIRRMARSDVHPDGSQGDRRRGVRRESKRRR